MIFQKIRESRTSKVIASYLAIQMLLQIAQPMQMFALTGGPSQPEFNSFTPIGTSDMVNLSSGDFNYNIPVMDVGGYPLNLAYNSGVTMDQESSWVGLGWNLNVGQIARNVRGLPDDFKGDKIKYENDIKDNYTIGVSGKVQVSLLGMDKLTGKLGEAIKKSGNASIGIGIQYNTYNGLTFSPSIGVGASFALSDNIKGNVGISIAGSTVDGATISPSIGVSANVKRVNQGDVNVSGNVGLSYNSRKGLQNFTLSSSAKGINTITNQQSCGETHFNVKSGLGGSISFNDQSYTPTKRAGVKNGNFTFSAGLLGSEFYGLEADYRVTGFGSSQKIREEEKNVDVPSFGYENTEASGGSNGVLDFNRDNDGAIKETTTILPITNYTYDLYAIQAQGNSGQFRPFRSQTGYVYDRRVTDIGTGTSIGAELGLGNAVHVGLDIEITSSKSSTGLWDNKNFAKRNFIENTSDNNQNNYESSFFVGVGDLSVDNESNIFDDKVYGRTPIRIGLGGGKHSRKTTSNFVKKNYDNNDVVTYETKNISGKIKRTQRLNRQQAIQKITLEEAKYDEFIKDRDGEQFLDVSGNGMNIGHHTAGIKILKPDGQTYIFGETAYNKKKVEATFDVSGSSDVNCISGLVNDFSGRIIKNGTSDRYVNKITTPPYVHTYLLTSLLSSDYEDIDNNGPTVNDLGTYTKFTYLKANNGADYKWRVPYEVNQLSYNEGLKSKTNDQKGSYLYGEKELKYIDKIETKTHVAYFKLSDREDGLGAIGEHDNNKGTTQAKQKKIDEIYLFTRPVYENDLVSVFFNADGTEKTESEINTTNNLSLLKKNAIKVTHFDYDYSLCQGVPNSASGKLTLKKVYFTYGKSNMGMYTPYTFTYSNGVDENPGYNLKAYDIWGNYKKEIGSCNLDGTPTNAEFPYTDQNETTANTSAKSWSLNSIELPSGGKIEIETESDDYQFVQNRKVMQMFNIVGAGDKIPDDGDELGSDPKLYSDRENHYKYIYVKVGDETLVASKEETLGALKEKFKDNLIGDLKDKAIQFRVLMNMTKNDDQYDYVTGYAKIDQGNYNDTRVFTNANGTYLSLALKTLRRDGKNKEVNPISKAGWYFGATYLSREVFSLGGVSTTIDSDDKILNNIANVAGDLVKSLGNIFTVFSGPNRVLEGKRCAQKFKPQKSWIRLISPTKQKYGGGLRVSKLSMHDNWDVMNNDEGNDLYKQHYGQEYTYLKEDGTSSGVASFEPAGSKENPFIEPVPTNENSLAAPQENNYVEKPIGASFFPSPKVTYSRVVVENLKRTNGSKVLSKHATGKMVHTFYTTYDFPTLTDHTDLNDESSFSDPQNFGSSILNFSVKNHLTMSQGFVVETNDMDGKLRSSYIYAENSLSPVSGVAYNYSVKANNTLNNTLPTISKDGNVTNKTIGLQYDVVNDFREAYSIVETVGVDTNVASFMAFVVPIIIPFPLPTFAYHEDVLRTAVTTKHIHKTAILKETINFDLGAKTVTENLAWDTTSGQVLLTKKTDAFEGKEYYNLKYPSYWAYEGMGHAMTNLGMEGYLTIDPSDKTKYVFDANEGDFPFFEGDMIMAKSDIYTDYNPQYEKLWITEIDLTDPDPDKKTVKLMNAEGYVINDGCSPYTKSNLKFKIIRSGYKNLQNSTMASITCLENPIVNGVLVNPTSNSHIINASAVRYSDFWLPQDELGLPRLTANVTDYFNNMKSYEKDSTDKDGNVLSNPPSSRSMNEYGFNPYLYNVRGEYRAVESYAYLTGRSFSTNPNLKNDGYYEEFTPFYKLSNGVWEKDDTNWTSASTVTEYSPYGVELENKDALDRYSSALYGYAYNLPIAVASNTKYKELAFDNFEDYDYSEDFNIGKSAIADNSKTEEVEGETVVVPFKRDHFRFYNTDSNNTITGDYAHSGIKSLKVETSESITKVFNDYQHTAHVYDNCLGGNAIEPGKTQPRITFGSVKKFYGSVAKDDSTLSEVEQINLYESNYILAELVLPVTFTGGTPNQLISVDMKSHVGGIDFQINGSYQNLVNDMWKCDFFHIPGDYFSIIKHRSSSSFGWTNNVSDGRINHIEVPSTDQSQLPYVTDRNRVDISLNSNGSGSFDIVYRFYIKDLANTDTLDPSDLDYQCNAAFNATNEFNFYNKYGNLLPTVGNIKTLKMDLKHKSTGYNKRIMELTYDKN